MSNEIVIQNGALTPRNFEGLYRLATIMSASGMMPKGMDRPESVFVAVQMGLEVGLSPMQAVQNIASINGRPTIWGDAMLGLVRSSGLLEAIKEEFSGEGEHTEAVCHVWRKGEDDPTVGRFSVQDAKRAQLWGKAGPWTQYPRRMLQMRARAFALRDKFPDVLKGLHAREEMEGVQEQYMGQASVIEEADATISRLNELARSAEPQQPTRQKLQDAPEPTQDQAPTKEPEPASVWPQERNRVLYARSKTDGVDMIPWDARFHSSTQTVSDDGTWRMRRGHDPELYARWLDGLKAQAQPNRQEAARQAAEARIAEAGAAQQAADPQTDDQGGDGTAATYADLMGRLEAGTTVVEIAAIEREARLVSLTPQQRDHIWSIAADMRAEIESR